MNMKLIITVTLANLILPVWGCSKAEMRHIEFLADDEVKRQGSEQTKSAMAFVFDNAKPAGLTSFESIENYLMKRYKHNGIKRNHNTGLYSVSCYRDYRYMYNHERNDYTMEMLFTKKMQGCCNLGSQFFVVCYESEYYLGKIIGYKKGDSQCDDEFEMQLFENTCSLTDWKSEPKIERIPAKDIRIPSKWTTSLQVARDDFKNNRQANLKRMEDVEHEVKLWEAQMISYRKQIKKDCMKLAAKLSSPLYFDLVKVKNTLEHLKNMNGDDMVTTAEEYDAKIRELREQIQPTPPQEKIDTAIDESLTKIHKSIKTRHSRFHEVFDNALDQLKMNKE